MGFDPATMATVALIASGASAAVQTYASVKQGEAQSAAARYEQQQHQQREEQLRTRAMQDEAARREELAANLSTIEQIRAGRGLSQSSPTALVIRDDLTDSAMDDMRVSRLNILNGADAARQAGEQAGSAASNALTTGYLGAGRSLLDFGSTLVSPKNDPFAKTTRSGTGER